MGYPYHMRYDTYYLCRSIDTRQRLHAVLNICWIGHASSQIRSIVPRRRGRQSSPLR